MTRIPHDWRLFVDMDMSESMEIPCAGGVASVQVRKRPGRQGCNEDAALVAPLDDHRVVLVASDGAGGLPGGALAARVAIECVTYGLTQRGESDLRICLRHALEDAHREISALGQGSATTANVVLIDGGRAWSFHVGDSVTMIFAADGVCKLRTIPHSPVGLQVRDGMLTEEQAIRHSELHLVHNLLGVGCCHVDTSAAVELSSGDTVVVATDGLFDNMLPREVIAGTVRLGLEMGVRGLADHAWRRMTNPGNLDPSKPDDLAIVAYRRT